jgi:hypothetical protein
MKNTFKIVEAEKEFKFKKLCPYCKGNLTYVANGWDADTETKYPRKLKKALKKKYNWPLWIATTFDCDCSTMPDFESDEFDDWMNWHSEMPYVHQLPVDQQVERYIKKRYRFNL